jgi:hypothetical protein
LVEVQYLRTTITDELGKQQLVDISLIRKPGAENLGWLDELAYYV